MRQLLLTAIMFVVVGWSQVTIAQSRIEKLVAESDLAVQAQIRATAIAFLSGGRSESEMRTNWKGFRELEKLKEFADDEQLVKQLAIYAVAEPRVEEQQALEALLILQLLQVKPSIPIHVLSPYLDSDDKLLRGFVRDWFESHGSRGAPRELAANYKDYSDYLSLTLNMGEEFPTPLVEYMFEQSPEQALLVFLRIDRGGVTIAQLGAVEKNLNGAREERSAVPDPKRRPQDQRSEIRLAARLISNAVWLKENGYDERLKAALPEVNELLAQLAEDERWWSRLYVAEIMRRHPELRIDDVLQKLREDGDESVKKAAKSIRE